MLVLDRVSATGTDNNTLSGISSESGQPLDGADSLREQFCEESPLDDVSEGREQFYQAYLKEIESEGGVVGVEEARDSEDFAFKMREGVSHSEEDESEGENASWDMCEDVSESPKSLHHQEEDYREILNFEAGYSSPPTTFDVSQEEMGQLKKAMLSVCEFEERLCAPAKEAMTREHSEDTLQEGVEKDEDGLQETDFPCESHGDSEINSEKKTDEDHEESVSWRQQKDDELRRFSVEQRQHDSYSTQKYSHSLEEWQEKTSSMETMKMAFEESFKTSSEYRSGYENDFSTSYTQLNQYDKLDRNVVHHYSQGEFSICIHGNVYIMCFNIASSYTLCTQLWHTTRIIYVYILS